MPSNAVYHHWHPSMRKSLTSFYIYFSQVLDLQGLSVNLHVNLRILLISLKLDLEGTWTLTNFVSSPYHPLQGQVYLVSETNEFQVSIIILLFFFDYLQILMGLLLRLPYFSQPRHVACTIEADHPLNIIIEGENRLSRFFVPN